MTYRIDIYRPLSDEAMVRSSKPSDEQYADRVAFCMRTSAPGAFALIIRVDGDEETVMERWRVSADGRILRAVFDVREPELEQT